MSESNPQEVLKAFIDAFASGEIVARCSDGTYPAEVQEMWLTENGCKFIFNGGRVELLTGVADAEDKERRREIQNQRLSDNNNDNRARTATKRKGKRNPGRTSRKISRRIKQKG